MKPILQLAWALPATLVNERALLATQESVGLIERCQRQHLVRGVNSLGGGWQPPADKNTKAAMLR